MYNPFWCEKLALLHKCNGLTNISKGQTYIDWILKLQMHSFVECYVGFQRPSSIIMVNLKNNIFHVF